MTIVIITPKKKYSGFNYSLFFMIINISYKPFFLLKQLFDIRIKNIYTKSFQHIILLITFSMNFK